MLEILSTDPKKKCAMLWQKQGLINLRDALYQERHNLIMDP